MNEYNPHLVLVTWGPIVIQGFAADSIIMTEYDEQAVTKIVGSKGDVAAVVNANRAGKATFRLQQGSATNALLAAASAQTRPDGASLVVYPFTVTDLLSNTLVEGAEAWIQKTASNERAKDHKDREWIIDIAKMITFG